MLLNKKTLVYEVGAALERLITKQLTEEFGVDYIAHFKKSQELVLADSVVGAFKIKYYIEVDDYS